jgi:hypothetical protein
MEKVSMLKKQLTSEEMNALTLATKGESYDHRRWPVEVVMAFASAPVITARQPRARSIGRRHPSTCRLMWPLRHG